MVITGLYVVSCLFQGLLVAREVCNFGVYFLNLRNKGIDDGVGIGVLVGNVFEHVDE